MIGQQLGQYRILARLGEGGMGAVYRAVDQMLDRDVALKMLRPELAHLADVIERFRAEAMTLARLDHPSIARLHGLAKEGGHLFMVMEFVPGETLRATIEREGAMPWRRAAALLDQLLDGLAYAHSAGVVHRDIKPANVIVRPDGRLKVTDFGIARVLGTSRVTKAGHIVGTLEYMAPEQIRGEDVDARADLYGAAIVFYELLTGRVPFAATSEYDLMQQQLNLPVPSVVPLATAAPAWCDALIGRAMAKAPADRFATAEEFRRQLQIHVAGEPEARADAPVKATRVATTPLAPTRLAVAPVAATRVAAPPAAPSLIVRVRTAPWHVQALAALAIVAAATLVVWQPWRVPAPPAVPEAPVGQLTNSNGPGLVDTTPPSGAPVAPQSPLRVVTPPSRVAEPASPVEFASVAMLVTDGTKAREQDVVLRFEAARLVVRDKNTGALLRALPYPSIGSATYSQSKQPRWKTAGAAVVLTGVLAAPLFFLKGTKHWLTLESSEPVLVLRLDKNNYQFVLPELRRRSGITVENASDLK